MKRYFFIPLLFLCTYLLHAQDIEDLVSNYSDENAYGYLEPLSDVFAADMNSGWYRDAHINHMKFQLYFGLVTTTGLIKNSQKTFEAVSPYGGTVQVPTIFGSNEPVRVQRPNGLAENYPGGVGMKILPLAVPQLSVGGLLGTEVSFRYFGIDVSDNVGKMSLFGWGIRHSISQYFDDLPIDIALGYYNLTYKLGDYIDTNLGLVSAQADYTLGMLDFYGGLGYEINKMDIEYVTDDETNEKAKHHYENNPFRFTAGLTLNLGIFKLHGDYNLSASSVFSLGMGLGFGTENK